MYEKKMIMYEDIERQRDCQKNSICQCCIAWEKKKSFIARVCIAFWDRCSLTSGSFSIKLGISNFYDVELIFFYLFFSTGWSEFSVLWTYFYFYSNFSFFTLYFFLNKIIELQIKLKWKISLQKSFVLKFDKSAKSENETRTWLIDCVLKNAVFNPFSSR